VKAWLAWSSGKDSAWALHVLRTSPDVEVVGRLTTVNEVHDRVAMHGVRRSLLQAQADALGLPLVVAPIPHPCSNEEYERVMSGAVARALEDGVSAFAFGDLFLEDIRRYRESRLEGTGVRPLFPIWGRPTAALAEEMIAGGLRAHVVTVDPRHLSADFAGRAFDRQFLADLPPSVDPCGENGEFHTFAWNGPMFREPVDLRSGVVVEREGFVFADLVPAGEA
jgi:uncharacterized protein (TIGR00290 family)